MLCALKNVAAAEIPGGTVPQRGWFYAAGAHSVAILDFQAFADIGDILVNCNLLDHIYNQSCWFLLPLKPTSKQ